MILDPAIAQAVEGRERLHVSVSDTGAGLESENLERVFEPFDTTKTEGLGMGLSICRSILETHGGTIWITANSGPGVTVQFLLPAGADTEGMTRWIRATTRAVAGSSASAGLPPIRLDSSHE